MMTITQNIFLCCLALFGPLFGIWGAYVSRKSRLGSIWGFAISCFSAYTGWFVSGLAALNLYPDYPEHYAGISFTLPESQAVLLLFRVL